MEAELKRRRPAKDTEPRLAPQGIGQFAYHFGFLSPVLAAQAAGLSLWAQVPRRLPPGRQEASPGLHARNAGLALGRTQGKGLGLRKERAS